MRIVLGEKVLDAASVLMRLFLGGVFTYAGFVKLLEPAGNFRAALYQYELIPVGLVPLLAAVLPWLEWLVGFCVLTGYGIRWSSLVLGLFAFSLAAMIFFSGKLWGDGAKTCGCFGENGPHLTFLQVFLLDLTNGFFGVLLWRLQRRFLTLDAWLLRQP